MASIAPGANATSTSAKRTLVVAAMIANEDRRDPMATANEPATALIWPSMVEAFIRAKPGAIKGADPDQRHAATQVGSPPSIREVRAARWRHHRAEISSPGNFSSRSTSATAIEGCDQAPPVRAAEAIMEAMVGGGDGAIPVAASISGSAAVRMITRMV